MHRSDSIAKLVPALIAAQRAMGPALKTAVNPHFRSKYVDLETAWEACREALWDQGLTVIQTTAVGGEGGTRLVTTLAHASGESISGEYPLKPAKDDPQGLAAAVTYARRISLLAIVGLAPEDDDGQTASRGHDRAQARPSREPGDDDEPRRPPPVSRPETPRQAPPGQREQRSAGDERGEHHGPPRSGKALFAWTKEQEQRYDVGLLKYLNNWAKLQDFPSRMVDWDAEQVALAYAEASRKLQSAAQPRGEAYDEALAN